MSNLENALICLAWIGAISVIFLFNSIIVRKHHYYFFCVQSFIITFLAFALAGIGIYLKMVHPQAASAWTSTIFICSGAVIFCALTVKNIMHTNIILGIIGSALQLVLFFIAAAVLLIPMLILLAMVPYYFFARCPTDGGSNGVMYRPQNWYQQ